MSARCVTAVSSGTKGFHFTNIHCGSLEKKIRGGIQAAWNSIRCWFSVVSFYFFSWFSFLVKSFNFSLSCFLMFIKKYFVFCNLHPFTDLIFIFRHSFYGSVFFISKIWTILFIYHSLKYLSSLFTVISIPLLSEFSFITCTLSVTNQQLLSSAMKIRTSDDNIFIAFVLRTV